MSNSIISIIIPTYNRSNKIERTLNSVLNQTYKNLECIVVDDFSTDDTKYVISVISKQDNRIRYVVNERLKGAQGARNTGILKASGSLIVLFDSDDIMLSTYIEKVYNKINKTNSDIVFSYTKIIDFKTGKEVGKSKPHCSGNVTGKLLSSECYLTINCLFKKDKLLTIGLLDESCPSHQELDTHIRLSKISKYEVVPEYLINYNVGDKDAISHDKKKHADGLLYILKKHKWLWRMKSYKAFLRRAENILKYVKENMAESSDNYFFKVLFFIPEFPLYLLLIYMKRNLKINK